MTDNERRAAGPEQSRRPVGYLNQKDAAAYLGVDADYFRVHVHVEPFVLPTKGKRPAIRYRVADLDAWMDKLKDPRARATRAA